jgi:hypothetical protein
VYADHQGIGRHNLDLWDKEGDKPFINRITLSEAVKNGYTILMATKDTRKYVIDLIHPDWIHNIKEEDVLFCNENDRGDKKR